MGVKLEATLAVNSSDAIVVQGCITSSNFKRKLFAVQIMPFIGPATLVMSLS